MWCWPGVYAVLISAVGMGLAGEPEDLARPERQTAGEVISEQASGWSGRQRLDAEASILWADGLVLSAYALAGRVTSDPFDLGLTVTRNEFAVTYEPEILGSPANLSEDRMLYTLDGRSSLGGEWSLLGSVAYYDGFTDYRSLWISEYYEQLFGDVIGYVEPSPKGRSMSLGVEWEYIPVMGKIRLTGGYGMDTIAPAYDFDSDGLVRSRSNLYTKTFQVQAENVLSARVAMQNTVQYTDTTTRDKRWSAQSAWNIAVAEGWFLRLHGGYSVEQPAFDAIFAGGVVELEFANDWFFRLNARYYEDTGEIENSLGGFSSSAPSLEAVELGAGIRWEGIHSALNLYVGYYQTEYGSLAEDNMFLKNLYNDRRWGLLQLSYTYLF